LASVGDLIEVHSVTALQKPLPVLKKFHKNYLVVGWGANQILPAQCDKLIIHLDFSFDQTYLDEKKR
jgi:hypothetical protein